MKKWMYYAIQWTWGIPMNIIGIFIFILTNAIDWIQYIFTRQHKIYNYWYRNAVCIVLPWNFGGFEMGMFFARGKNDESVCAHEYGHSIQNLWWGILFPFVICIPSMTRYWYRRFYMKFLYKKIRRSLSPYDSVWFEGQATQLGNKANANNWAWL